MSHIFSNEHTGLIKHEPKVKLMTPLTLFSNHKKLLGLESDFMKIRHEYLQLSDEEKRKWISRAVQGSPEVIPSASILSGK